MFVIRERLYAHPVFRFGLSQHDSTVRLWS